MLNNYLHTTVLLKEAVSCLNINPGGIYLDGTFGQGGHSKLILSKLNEKGRLFAIDRDLEAIKIARTIMDHRFTVIHGTFSKMAYYMAECNLLGKVDGILLDLGVSSMQLDNPDRGFSFMRDGPLDMRMDTNCGQTAAQWLAQSSEKDISWVLKNFGEENLAKRIAHAIVLYQKRYRPITRTLDLASLIVSVSKLYNKHKHPATRSFQAIRICVNSELEEIECALKSSLILLAPKGRLSVISFHSLEDRIVKKFIRQYSCGSIIPSGIPLTETQILFLCQNSRKLIEKGKIYPSNSEIKNNYRARSSILRFAERLT